MKQLALLVSFALSACCTDSVIVKCPALSSVSNETRLQLKEELSRIPGGSATMWAIGDWMSLRDQIRACLAETK